jgi:hypothetical protein
MTLFVTPSNKKNTTRINGLLLLFLVVMGIGGVNGQSTYNLITSTSDLTAGSKYIVVSSQLDGSAFALGYQATNNRPQASVTISSGAITTTPATSNSQTTAVFELTLGGTSGAWTLYDAANITNIGANSNSSNNLRANASSTWTISFSSNAAVMTSTGGTRNILRYNSGNSLFSCYASLQASVYLYKASTSGPTITTSVPTIPSFISSNLNTLSSEQSFTVSGSNLTNNITVTPPTGYQVSTTSGSGFGSSVTLPESSGTVTNTTIYARFNPTALADQVGGNITCASTGASTQNVAVSGEVTNLSAGAIAFVAFQGATTDYFRIVALQDIPANTRIWFSDNEWDGSLGTPAFTAGEGNSVWTSPGSTITKGTVIEFAVTAGTVTNGTGAFSSGLSSTQEQLFAYQGTAAIPTFVAGFTTGVTISSGTPTDINTWIPSGLTSGTNFMALSGTGTNFGSSYITSATHNRSLADMRSHIHNTSNSTTSNSTTTTYSSWPTYTFNIIADEPTTQPSFSAATAIGNNQLDLNFSGGNGTSYMVVMREGSAVTATPTDATNYSLVSGSVNFASATELSAGQKIVYNGTTSTGSVTITNLSAGTTYHYAIYAYNGTTTKANFYLTSPGTGNQLTTGIANSNVSDIIIHASFTEPSNIDYASSQENSNLTFGTSVEVAQFTLRDGGASADGDANSTTLNTITFTIAGHTNLRRLALYDGSTELGEIAISSGTATFSGLTIAAGDNSTKDFSLRASFAGTVTDNSQFSFTISSVTADIAGSTFATADAGAAASSTTGDRNKIEVSTTEIIINQNVSNVTVGVVMSPSPSVTALDNLANFDLDNTSNVTMTITTGTTTFDGAATTTVAMVAGTATFTNLVFTTVTNSNRLTATQGLLTDISSIFNVISGPVTLVAGDIAVIGYNTSGSPDDFAILILKDLTAGTNFYVNDNEVSSTGGTSFADLSEGEAKFTVKSGQTISAGTVIRLPWGAAAVSTPTYDFTSTSVAGFSNNNEEIYIYNATAITDETPTSFIYFAKIGASTSSIPSGLTSAITSNSTSGSALMYKTSGAIYNGCKSTLLSAIGNTDSNWTATSVPSPLIPANWTFSSISLSANIWTGGTSNWSTDANWSCTTIPNIIDNIEVSSGNVTLDVDFILVSGKTLTISNTGIFTINPTKKLTIAGTADFGGKTVIIKSDSNGTGAIGQVTGTLTGATNVTVERYIPAKRAWRALTAPLKGSTNNSIYYNWQNNGSVIANTGVEIWSNLSSLTNVTSGGTGSSLLTYNSVGNSWTGVTNTSTTNLFSSTINNPFMVFVTGPFATSSTNITSGTAATTLKATGSLITGTQSYATTGTQYTLIGNPYASSLSLTAMLSDTDNSTNFNNGIWIWDSNGNATVGSYNYFDKNASAYSYTNSTTPASNPISASAEIQSGQAFFVQSSSGNAASFSIKEAHKGTSVINTVFRDVAPAQLLRVGLYKQENNEWSGRDGAMTVILPDANANQTPNKMANGTENVAFVKNGSLFASEHHLPLVASDVLNIRVWRTTAGANYKLKINTEDFVTTNLSATLEDLFTNSRTPLNLEGAAVEYPFTVTTDALSTGDRFRIVFQNAVLGTNNPTATSFSIVPNPVTGDSFQVNLGTLATGTYSYSICNAIGQEVEKGTLNNATQNTNYEVKMSNSATGIYIMKIKGSDNSVITAKLIKK